MKIISIANLKGGVAKTVTSVNVSYILTALHGKKVLLLDNDMQANATQFFGLYNYDQPSVADLMVRHRQTKEVIQPSGLEGLDIIPANLSLAKAEKDVLIDSSGVPQQVRLREALRAVKNDYDYVIIDNAPALSMSVVNALATSDYLIVPIKIDRYSFDGVDIILDQAAQVKKYYNPSLQFLGSLVTLYRRNETNLQGVEWLNQSKKYKVFDTRIRWTDKVDESTFSSKPIMIHSPRCGAAKDYLAFTEELLRNVSESDTSKEGGKDGI